MLPSDAFIMMSVWMLSVNIRLRDARAVALDRFCVNPSAQMEQGSPPYTYSNDCQNNVNMLASLQEIIVNS